MHICLWWTCIDTGSSITYLRNSSKYHGEKNLAIELLKPDVRNNIYHPIFFEEFDSKSEGLVDMIYPLIYLYEKDLGHNVHTIWIRMASK